MTGFRLKLVLYTIALKALVIVMIAIPLYHLMGSDRIIIFVALAAFAIGIVFILVFSSLITRPLKELVSHVEMIRDSKTPEDMANVKLKIDGNDEFALLSRVINDMNQRLIKATEAASNLSVGKEFQKKFLPLDTDNNGNMYNSGLKDAKNAAFFGYYEGAIGLSGDYFNYIDLDGRYYAVIKCDIAGKGIPAALLMIQVATMFVNYFKNWKLSVSGMHIEEIVYQINDFIEELGFKGRFAAFTLCLFDSETGDLHFCNAGDNLIHICDTSEKRIRSITLPASPAAGVVSNSMVEAKGGYQVQSITLDHGDILLLYTDGIEEAQQRGETMGRQRVYDIINAVLNRQTYILEKLHNADGEELHFDFSSCNENVEEVIMALISVEKMFRCYRNPKFTREDCVPVDKKIDSFLRKHFLQYGIYCSHMSEHPEKNSYVCYTHLTEDEQYDDLAILGIKRK